MAKPRARKKREALLHQVKRKLREAAFGGPTETEQFGEQRDALRFIRGKNKNPGQGAFGIKFEGERIRRRLDRPVDDSRGLRIGNRQLDRLERANKRRNKKENRRKDNT